MRFLLITLLLIPSIATATLTNGRVPVVKDGSLTFPSTQDGSITDTGTSSGAGNVGINSTTPGQRLDVVGTVRATSFSTGSTGSGGIRTSPAVSSSNGANVIGGYSGNTIDSTAYASGVAAGGISGGENKINYSANGGGHDQYQQIGGGYDNQMTSAWPSYIFGAHNRINQAPSVSDTYFAGSNLAGTVTSTGTAVEGSGGTAFSTNFSVGNAILASGQARVITAITDADTLTVDVAFSPDVAGVTYKKSGFSFPNIWHSVYSNTNHVSILSGTYQQINNSIYGTIGGGTQNNIGWDPYSLTVAQSDNATISGGDNNIIAGVPTAGVGTVASSGTAVTGTGLTAFTTVFTSPGTDIINVGNQSRVVTAVADNTHLTVGVAFSPDVSGASWTKSGTGLSSTIAGGESHLLRGTYGSIVGGFGCTVNGNFNVCGGQSNTMGTTSTNKTVRNATNFGGGNQIYEGADYSVAIGNTHTIGSTGSASNGGYSATFGRNNFNNALYGLSFGWRAKVDVTGQLAQAVGQFANQGDAQGGFVVEHMQTTDATQTTMTITGAAVGTVNPQDLLFLRSNQAKSFVADIIAKKSTTTDLARWQFKGIVYRDSSGNMGLVTAVGDTAPDESNGTGSAWRVALDTDNTNKALIFKVTGAAGTTIGWVAYIKTVEVTI
jgi:hypothetical protein